MVEQRPFKALAVGSSPTQPKPFKSLAIKHLLLERQKAFSRERAPFIEALVICSHTSNHLLLGGGGEPGWPSPPI
jgi:hypothetical protein